MPWPKWENETIHMTNLQKIKHYVEGIREKPSVKDAERLSDIVSELLDCCDKQEALTRCVKIIEENHEKNGLG